MDSIPQCCVPQQYSTDQVGEVALRVLNNYKNKIKNNLSNRYVISLAGIPGSGKSTFAEKVTKELNGLDGDVKAVVLPQDGFHLYRAELQQLPNAEEAVTRRGAPFTFNANAFVGLVAKLNDPQYLVEAIQAPSFDHKLKDPVENDIHIGPDTRIIIVEGNYVSLTDDYWNRISDYVDETWFIQTPMEIVRDRIVKRHLDAGIAASHEEAIQRVDGSDLVNAHYVLNHSKTTDVVIITESI